MKAQKLDRAIVIQRSTSALDDMGQEVAAWSDIVSMRVQVIQASTKEFFENAGARGEEVLVFRMRWLSDLSTRDRILFDGVIHEIQEIKELGRRSGLELRTVARNAQ